MNAVSRLALSCKGQPVVFDPEGKHGEFGKSLLPMYLDITRFVLGLAAGSIVLLVGSLNFNQSSTRSLKRFASPLFLVAMSIIACSTSATSRWSSALWFVSASVTCG